MDFENLKSQYIVTYELCVAESNKPLTSKPLTSLGN